MSIFSRESVLFRGGAAHAITSLPVFCLLAFIVALVPTLVILNTVQFALETLGADMTAWSIGPTKGERRGVVSLFGAILLAPVLETYIIALVIGLAKWFAVPRPLHACLWSPVSFRHAFIAATIPHVLVNCAAAVADAWGL